MKKLSTIQKRYNLNAVYAVDGAGAGNASHEYRVFDAKDDPEKITEHDVLEVISFQHGARNEGGSTRGVLDTDLLEIVRDRLKGFQSGEFACRENACALTHIEEALMWMNRRVEERAERNVLGTNKK